ncbi:NADP-dependent oxidoreductase domain-containing protein [Gongronella butleri]|nr:NADP-dependent oxidoreductase domain-containing protein [Gongronella butleri]
MEYTRLGKSGLMVSRIALGGASFGDKRWMPAALEGADAVALMAKAWDKGIRLYDTAGTYSNGTSERLLGTFIREHGIPRAQIVVGTKINAPVFDDMHLNVFNADLSDPALVNRMGLSRKAIMDGVQASLDRLGLTYIDLLTIHRFDPNTPIEETMEALHDLVKQGKVRYLGASSMYTWQFVRMNAVAEKNGWTPFIAMQNYYNVVYREEEREMIPYLQDQGIGQTVYSPLAGGVLAAQHPEKLTGDDFSVKFLFKGLISENDKEIMRRVATLAMQKGITRAQVALAWLLSKEPANVPIVGAYDETQLQEAVDAVQIKLARDEIEYLESAYQPHRVIFM